MNTNDIKFRLNKMHETLSFLKDAANKYDDSSIYKNTALYIVAREHIEYFNDKLKELKDFNSAFKKINRLKKSDIESKKEFIKSLDKNIKNVESVFSVLFTKK